MKIPDLPKLELCALGICLLALNVSAAGPVFRAGAAAANITPALGVSINGYFSDRKAEHIHDELHARSLVLDDGTNRLAIVVCDSCMLPRDLLDNAKASVKARTGLPSERILISSTHTHFAPSCVGIFQSEPDEDYCRFVESRIADSVIRAIHNLAPAQIGVGKGAVPGQLFNRRWKMKPGTVPPNPFGGTNDAVKMNPPVGSPDLIEPAGPTDPEVYVLSVKRPDGAAIAVLANYGLHYVGAGGSTDVSADYFGAFCAMVSAAMGSLESDPPFVAMLANGTSGDVNNINFREKRPASAPYAQNKAVARDVANEVLRVIRTMSYQTWVPLDSRQREVTFDLRMPKPEEVERARAILATAGNPAQLRTPEEIYARETVLMSAMTPNTSIILQAMRIGDVAIAAIPCEVFAETGLAIKSNAPFNHAFTIELANGCSGYLPTPEQHKLGGYETWRARSSCLETGAEPRIRAEVLAMMNELK
jgi:hypothetical protein